MSVGVGFTALGRVAVRDLETYRTWLLTPDIARRAADEFEVIAASGGSAPHRLEIATDEGVGFTYSGAPEHFADMARQLRDMAAEAAKWGGGGHA